MKTKLKTKKKYTMSAKALEQRRKAGQKVKNFDLITTKIDRSLKEWAQENFGSLNRLVKAVHTVANGNSKFFNQLMKESKNV